MPRCLLALGANLGDRAGSLDKALALISAIPGVRLLSRSSWHETAPVGGPEGQRSFLNGAVLLEATLSPQALAQALRDVEERLGRKPKVRWDARTLDIDLLLFNAEVIGARDLQIPHPRMSVRQFVLVPAAEIAGEMVHPTSGWTIAALLNHWRTAPRHVAIFGNDPELSEWLGNAILEELNLQASDRDDPFTIKLVSMDEKPSMVISLGDSARVPGPMGLIGPISPMGPIGPIVRVKSGTRAEILHEALAGISAAWPDNPPPFQGGHNSGILREG